MLVDEPGVESASRDPILMMLAAVADRPVKPSHPQTGVYVVGHFGSSDMLRGTHAHYPDLRQEGEEEWGGMNCYGVCDRLGDILERCPMLVTHPTRQFTITLTKVVRDQSNAGRGGGWRWHKWGEYIGKQTPTTEYLDDEPVIESVYVFHVYEKGVKDRW